MSRVWLIGPAFVWITAGPILRLPQFRLPLIIHHFEGAVLWGGMIFKFWAAAQSRPRRRSAMMIPIGGNCTMDPAGAAYALRVLLKPRWAIPMHYGTTPQLKGTPDELIRALGPGTSTRIVVMTPGETKDF